MCDGAFGVSRGGIGGPSWDSSLAVKPLLPRVPSKQIIRAYRDSRTVVRVGHVQFQTD